MRKRTEAVIDPDRLIDTRARKLAALMKRTPDAVVWRIIGDNPQDWRVVGDAVAAEYSELAPLLSERPALVIAWAKFIRASEDGGVTDATLERWLSAIVELPKRKHLGRVSYR